MADFVTLSCPNCGGKLEITQDVDRFACGHCGQEHIVKRSGSIVTLSPIVDALKKVGIGVDKTAAELAIVRLQKEIGELQAKRNTLAAVSPRPATSILFVLPVILGCIIAPTFLIIMSQNKTAGVIGILVGLALIIAGSLPLFFFRPDTKHWDETTGAQLKSLDGQIISKKTELKHNQDVVSL